MRWVLPVAVFLAFFGATVAYWLNPLKLLAKLPVEVGNIVVSGTKITMQQPRLAGFTRDSRPYEVLANAALQDIARPELLELEQVHAKIEMRDKSMVNVTALKGFYNNKTEMLTLKQDVVVVTATYQAWMDEALVDVRKNSMVSDKPVVVKMKQGIIKANRLEVTSSGELIIFDQGVNMDLIDTREVKR